MNNHEKETLVLILPISPSVNDSYGITIKGKFPIKYVKTQAKEYFAKVKEYVLLNNFNVQANTRLKMEVIINFATNHRNDLDNRIKAMQDSLVRANVINDDSLIDELHVIRGTVSKPGSMIVKISEFKP